MTIGQKIKSLRVENNMTQDDLGNKLFVTRNAISKWETNKGKPSIDNIESLAKIFNVSIDELMRENQSKTMIDNHSLFVFILSIICLLIYAFQSPFSMTLFIAFQICIYAFSTITVALVNSNQLKYNNGLYRLVMPVFISLIIQGVLGLLLEL
ncbi:MAG: helix-turn-helix domain-containing protein [Candidatus Izemoplasmatales bacterium]